MHGHTLPDIVDCHPAESWVTAGIGPARDRHRWCHDKHQVHWGGLQFPPPNRLCSPRQPSIGELFWRQRCRRCVGCDSNSGAGPSSSTSVHRSRDGRHAATPARAKPGVITEPAHRLNERLQSLCTAGASTAPAGLSYAGTARCRTTAAARQVRTAPATWPYARVAQMGTYGEERPGCQRNGQVLIHVVSITAVVQIGAGVRLGHRRRLSRSTSPSYSVKPLHPTTSTLLTRSSHTCSTPTALRTNRHAVRMEIQGII
jgi:hypothetical protein